MAALSPLAPTPSRFSTPEEFEAEVDAFLISLATLRDEIAALTPVTMITTTFSMNLTTLAANSSSAFDVTVTGVDATDTLVVTPVEWSTNSAHRARIDYSAYYVSANTVRVLVKNNDGSSATLTAGTWRVSALRLA